MARKPSGSDSVRSETLTIRLPQATRWAVEVLSRIHQSSVASQIQEAVDSRLEEQLTVLGVSNKPFSQALGGALRDKNALPHDRVLRLAESAAELLTRGEAQTLRLLGDLGALEASVTISGKHAKMQFKYDPLVLRVIWGDVESCAQKETIDIEEMKRLKALVMDALSLVAAP